MRNQGLFQTLEKFCKPWKKTWVYIINLEKIQMPKLNLSNLLLIVSKSGPATSIQTHDIWWSSLDIMDDFKLISRMVFFLFRWKNKSLFWVLSKKFFKCFFSSNYNNFFFFSKCFDTDQNNVFLGLNLKIHLHSYSAFVKIG